MTKDSTSNLNQIKYLKSLAYWVTFAPPPKKRSSACFPKELQHVLKFVFQGFDFDSS
jgi:hypothetical protein